MDNFNNGKEFLVNGEFLDSLYSDWKKNPDSVSKEWQIFFEGFSLSMCPRSCVSEEKARKQSNVSSLIYAYRSLGHLIADTNPLSPKISEEPEFLSLNNFDLEENDLNSVFDAGHLYGVERATLKEIIETLKVNYCGKVGIEYIHIQNKEERRFIQQLIEPLKIGLNFLKRRESQFLEI